MEEKTTSSGHQQFNLRWNNHANNILQVFMEQFTSDALTDVTIACEGHVIKAHKMVLSACSLYFQELFRLHVVKHPYIIMNGMKYIDVKQVIDFMYRGEVKVLETELDSLLAVAESLQVKGLSTVRNNYEKANNALKKDKTKDEITAEQELPKAAKRRKCSSDDDSSKKSNDAVSDDESLSSTIKIEPPEINDIDPEEVENAVEETKKAKPAGRKTKRAKRVGRPAKSNTLILPKTWQIRELPAVVTASKEKVTKDAKIPRPPNAFMIFANEWRKKLASQFPKESNKEISVRLGLMWKNLSTDLKENYYTASRKADEEHKIKYPGYYYSPKEARIRKNLKVLDMAASRKAFDPASLMKLVMKENNDIDPRRWIAAPETSEDKGDIESDKSESSDSKDYIIKEEEDVDVEMDDDSGDIDVKE